MKKIIFIISLVISINQSNAQSWFDVNGGIDWFGYCFFKDTMQDVLFVGGGFHHAGGIQAHGIAKWNGVAWDSVGSGADQGAPVYSIVKWNDTLYASSLFYSTAPNNWFSKWNGSTWDLLSPALDGPGSFLCNDTSMIIFGDFKSLGVSVANKIVRFNGTSWFLYPFPVDLNSGTVSTVVYYQGNLIVGGDFSDTLTQTANLEMWNGSTFQRLGGFTFHSGYGVSSMAVYNSELYIGGWFTTADGEPGDYIMKWDGTNFSGVGGGLNHAVNVMKVYNNELYVGGQFNLAGGLSVTGLAKWDGVSWHAVGPPCGNSGINDIEFYHNQLYITGFLTCVSGNIARLDSFVSVNEFNPEINFTIYPNPSGGNLLIEFETSQSKKCSLTIFNTLGEKISEHVLAIGTKQFELNISEWAQGVYTCQLTTENGVVVKKLLKE